MRVKSESKGEKFASKKSSRSSNVGGRARWSGRKAWRGVGMGRMRGNAALSRDRFRCLISTGVQVGGPLSELAATVALRKPFKA